MIRIIGSQGIIGKHLSKTLFSREDLFIHPSNTWKFELPSDMQGDTVFYFRAISSPFLVEKNLKEAFRINVTKTNLIIEQLLTRGARIIFASSDVVYGDTGRLLATESSQIKPFGKYAIQKSIVEEKFRVNPNFLALRLSSVVGEGSKLRESLQNEIQYKVYDPIIRNPIHIKDLLILLEKLINVNFSSHFPAGVLNVGGSQPISNFELACLEATHLGVKMPVKVNRSTLDITVRPGTVRMNSDLAQRFANLTFDLRKHYIKG